MDAHTLKILEFGSIVSKLRERTACALGDDIARHLHPSADLSAVVQTQQETSEARSLLLEDGGMPLGGIHDVRAVVKKSTMAGVLWPSELLEISGTLASGRRLRRFILKGADECPKLAETAAEIGEFPKSEEAITGCIGENAEVLDRASPELTRIRSRLKSLHNRLVDKLNSIIHSAEFRTMIQDPVVTQRGDRYCVPIKSEHRPHFPGIVHDSSASGATVFIEPASVVEMGNDLKELAAKEQHEVEKILIRLSRMVEAAAPDIQITLSALGRLDFASAKAKLSCDMQAVEPTVNSEGRLDMINARHPLLEGDVVPIDIELGKNFTALLITGPNTGGKTVTLKTIGLLTLMAQSGLHIPAAPGSELAVFDQVFADIGDEQSIQQSLSTFSSHMTNIVNVVRRLGKNALVLLDEIGAGTDPAEGAALAKAILDNLVQNGARTVATTHYGELKEFAFARDGVENASVEFDVATLQPTYRLMIGVPGSSNAFAIASRLGLPPQLVHSAREMVQGGEASEEIIRKIEQTHRAVAEKEQRAERTSRDVEILRARYEQRLEELEALRRGLRNELADEIERRVREKIEELDRVIEDLKSRPEPSPRKLQEGRRRFKERVKQIRLEVEEIVPTYEEPDEAFVLRPGDTVRVTTLDVDGELLNDPGEGDALVQLGSMKINVPFSVLKPARRPRSRPPEPTGAAEITSSRAGTVSPELKLIAQRVEQALEKLDKYLDDAYLAGVPSARIIHGKGTGALRKAVWEFLEGHHAVRSFRLGEKEEGGAGATIVEFKEK